MFTFERDQRRLHLRAEEVHRVLLAIEIDDKIEEVLELGLSHELAQDRLISGSGPPGVYRQRVARAFLPAVPCVADENIAHWKNSLSGSPSVIPPLAMRTPSPSQMRSFGARWSAWQDFSR